MMRSPNQFKGVRSVELEAAEYSSENDINVRVIAFAVAAVVIILVAIFFIKTYAAQKQEVLETLRSESNLLETYCHETFDHNLYVLHLLSNQIKESPHDLTRIANAMKHYSTTPEIRELFAWKEFIWVDKDLKQSVSSRTGVIEHPKTLNKEFIIATKKRPRKALYWANLSDHTASTPLIYTLMSVEDQDGEYIGSIAINYDARALNAHLSKHKQNNYTNFILLDHNYNVIIQSKSAMMEAFTEHGKIVNEHISELVRNIYESSNANKSVSYIDMLSGTNYHIKKIANEPFILLINLDNDEIRDTIFRSIVMKFLEISIFASMFLLLIVAIYKRETWLRSKAEKAYQLAVKATEAKTDFLAYTAHEIRSPLGFIVTGSELMCKKMLGPVPKKYLEYMEGIHRSAKLILEFINDILDDGHIIAGNFKIVESSNDLSIIIDTAVVQNKTRYANKHINIKLNIEPNLPKLICDARRILQVITNLLSNSIKYSEDNSEILVSVRMNNGELELKIKDHGIGMSEDEIKIALTKYGTIYKEPFNLIESYGLGLPIVKLLLDAHEAIFSVESEVDVGTTITISFPRYKLDIPENKVSGGKDEEQ